MPPYGGRNQNPVLWAGFFIVEAGTHYVKISGRHVSRGFMALGDFFVGPGSTGSNKDPAPQKR